MKKSINFNGAEVFYVVKGTGIPLLLLHGFAENSNVWRNLTAGLAEFQLILPDLPGSGLSEPIEKDKVSMSDYASCLAAILSQEKIEAVHFIGHSMGGYIAIEFANMHPEKLKSLCLFHSSVFKDDEEKIETRRKAIDFINNHGSAAFLKTSIPKLFKNEDIHKQHIETLIAEGGSFSNKTLVQYYNAMISRKDHAVLLGELEIPVLFIIGEHDKAVPFNISLKQCYLPAISFVHILRNSAHMAMFEEADEVIAMIKNFITRVTTA